MPSLVLSANRFGVPLIPSFRSSIKILNRTGPDTEPWGALWAQVIIFYPLKGAPVHATGFYFLQENDVGDNIKDFTKVQANIIHVSLSTEAGHLIIGNHVGQAGPDFTKPMLDGPDPLAVLHLLCDGLVMCSCLGTDLTVL